MSNIIANPKTYTGNELSEIFFRPMLTGADAQSLGIKILYNMPVPTTLNYWHRSGDILKSYAKGWAGGSIADKFQKTINLSKVKSEMGYSASDYFGMVWEQITNKAGVNLDDLSGTELEAAETQLFREAIAESIRATMWLGDTTRDNGGFNSFDGLIKSIKGQLASTAGVATANKITHVTMTDLTDPDAAQSMFEALWLAADPRLRQEKSTGNLRFFVTDDVYENYTQTLEGMGYGIESAAVALQDGRDTIKWRGVEVVNIGVSSYLGALADMPNSVIILTDSRNLALAVNSTDYPGSEIRMWYNPDEMENRQRAIFMAGTEALLPELIVASFVDKVVEEDEN
ncbi:MAG: hypothetical protein R3Y68_08585 [Rikenellaceae bacterium]